MRRKTTAELLTEAMLRLGERELPVGDYRPSRKRKPKTRRSATARNGKAR